MKNFTFFNKGLNWSSLLIISATLVVSGFFVFTAIADTHTTTVNIDPQYVASGSTGTYTFTITNNGPDAIKYIRITAPNSFMIKDALVCPSNWAKNQDSSSYITCTADEELENYLAAGDSVQVSLIASSTDIDGTYNWEVKTRDILNIWNTQNPTTIVDDTAPTILINPIATPTQIASQIVTGTFTEANIDNIQVNGVDATISDNTYSVIITLSEGSNIVSAVATDKVGLTGSAEQIVILDTTPPVTSDDASEDWTNGDVEVTLTADDGEDGSEVAHTYYTTDGTPPTTESTLYEEPFILSEEGIYPLMYFSVDNAGNVEESVTGHIVKIDKSKPTTNYSISPELPNGNGGWYVTTAPTITLSCTDQTELSGCEGVYSRWRDSGEFTKYTSQISAPEGDKILYYYSKDNAGNQEDNQSKNIKTDTIAPTITDNAPKIWKNTDFTVTLTPLDYESGIGPVLYCEGSGCIPSINLTPSYQLTYSSQGEIVVRYQATDTAGNASDIGEYTIKIDKTPPTAGVSGQPTNWVNSDQPASATCSDTGGSGCDVSNYKLQVSTVSLSSCSSNASDYTIVSPATISQHSWVCSYVKDVAGNGAFSPAVTEFKVDKTPPTGSLTGVSPDWQNTNASITLTYADEGGSGIKSQSYGLVNIGSDCTYGTSYTVPVTVNQHKTFCWKVVDNAGNIASGESEIKVDKIAPSVNAGSDKITNAQFTRDATASDGDSGVATYLWEKVSGSGTITFGTPNAEDTTISANTDGTYTIRLIATDNAGNSASDEMTLTWDTTNPTVEITSPTENQIIRSASGQVSLGFTATDLNGVTCFYKIDGGSEEGINCASPVNINIPDGRHMITLIARDPAGNESSPASVSILMDRDNTFTVDDTPENNPDFATIQGAITNALAGYTISITEGSYTLTSTLNLSLAGLTIRGENQNGVIINASGVSGYGITNTDGINDITLESFTLLGPTTDANTSYGIKATHTNNLTIKNVTVKKSGRSEFDLNTVNGGLLENITADGQDTKGVGIALSHSSDITLKNITTQGNTWGGVGLFDTAAGLTTNVTFEGTNNFGEPNPVYIDAEYGFGAANIVLPGFTHAVRNSLNPRYTSFQQSESNAILAALAPGEPVNAASYIQTLGRDVNEYISLENNFIIGNGMTIQTAINAASAGATINVSAGTYNENVIINKSLLLNGSDSCVIKGALQLGVNNITVNGLTINGGNLAGLVGTDKPTGIYIVAGTSGHTIENNKIIGGGFTGPPSWTGGRGILFGYNVINTIVTKNEISDWLSGVYINPSSNSNLTFTTNNIHHNYAGIGSSGISNVTISGNTFANNTEGFGSDTVGTNVEVHINKFISNTAGVNWYSGTTNKINAQQNWWGQLTGPASGQVSTNVTYRPWCVEETCTTLDNASPTVTISSTATSPTKTSPIPITVTFSESVSDFEINDITVTNGTAGSFSGSGTTYNFSITPVGEGSVQVDIPAEKAWDMAGNYNAVATQFSITYDSTLPTLSPVSISSNNTNTTLAKVGDIITLNFTSSENIQTPTITIAGHTAMVSGSDTSWSATYAMTSSDTEGIVGFVINFSDLAGNAGTPVTATTDASGVTFDKTAPEVSITTPVSDSRVNATAVIEFTITDGTSPQCSVDNANWTTCTSETTTLGQIPQFVGLAETTFTLYLKDTDTAGNIGTASVSLIKDTTAPTVVSYSPSDNAVGIDPTENITVTFDEAVNISSGNITLQKEGGVPVSTAVTFDETTKIATINPDSDLADNSTYTIILSGVTDEADNVMNDESWSFTTAASYAIELKTGWNLISLPVTPTTWASITAVLASVSDNVQRVWTYNAVNGTWSVYNTDGAPSDLNIMVAGHGYWVKMTGNDTLTGVGTLYEQLIPSGDTPPSQLPEIPLAEGWNLIGYYQLPGKVNSPIGNALSKLSGAWSGSGSELITFTKATLQPITPITTMKPGEGYWIFMSSVRKYSFGDGNF